MNFKTMKPLRLLGGAALAAVILSACTPSTDEAASMASEPIAEGQKIVMATHSFNVFIGPRRFGQEGPGPLNLLAEEAGKEGQEFLAVQMIGGSTPMQHWNQGDGDDSANIAKAALIEGGEEVDVFTMSPNAIMPEEGIDNFGDFVIEHNPNARIMVQASWSAYDGNGSTPAVGGTGGGDFTNAQRDDITVETLDEWLSGYGPNAPEDSYIVRMRTQLEGIDERAGHQITYVVPSAVAVYNLRKMVAEGEVPGVAAQSELFRDPIGHGAEPVTNLVTYVWFAAMYRQSPVGLTALVNPEDETSAARERILQQLAWNAVIDEPKSGVVGAPVEVGS